MRTSILFAAFLFIASTFAVVWWHPSTRTISVGDRYDDARRLLDFYGMGESYFNLRSVRNAEGNALDNHNFAIGGRKQALIWHDNLIREIHTFDYIDPEVPGTYGGRENNQDVNSFTLVLPSRTPYFIGLAVVACLSGLLAMVSRFSIRIPLFIVLILGGILIWSMSPTMKHFPVFPVCWAAGWVAAFALGFFTIRLNQVEITPAARDR